MLLAVAITSSSATFAQVGAAISIFNDDRFRGYSLSDGRPVSILDLSYDAPNGLYGALSGSAVATRHDGLQPLGVQINAGYAKRLASDLTLDFGVIHSDYSRYSTRGPGKSYTEIYGGIAGKFLSGRISISPDYLRAGEWSAYVAVDGNVPAGTKLRFIGHAGMLVPLEGGGEYDAEFDWRLGIARDFGPVTGSVAWSGRAGKRKFDRDRYDRRNALIFGLTYVL